MTADPITPAVPVIQRWRRHGHDRAYVKLGSEDVGYRDLETGTVHCARSDDADLVTHVTAAMYARVRAIRQVSEYQPRHMRSDDDADRREPKPQT